MFTIPPSEIHIEFVRSSGPGGQNVNKTATKAQLRWSLFASPSLSAEEKERIAQKLAGRLTQHGEIAIDVDEERSQLQNKQRAIEILQNVVSRALEPDKPRIPTKTPASEKLDRLANKRKRSRIKELRKSVEEE